jgi:hypothetical protein
MNKGLVRGREGIRSARPERALVMIHGRSESGQSLLEIAVVFPLFVLVILAIGAVAWTFWVQAASAIASQEAARHAAYRAGDTFDPTAGYGPFSEAMSGITGSTSAGYIGNPEIVVDPATRSVRILVSRGATFTTPATSAEYTFMSGTFTRIMQFFGGPPDPWE